MTAAQIRTAEHKAFLKALLAMQRLALEQAKVLGVFMKSYEVSEPPVSRVMDEEREWVEEQHDRQVNRLSMSAMVPVNNPFNELEM